MHRELFGVVAIVIAAGGIAPANAFASPPATTRGVVTYLNWSGTDCIDIRRANQSNPTEVVTEPVCTYTGQWFFPEKRTTGQLYGADPIMGSATEITCNVKVDGVLVASEYAAAGDGHDANCLRVMQ